MRLFLCIQLLFLSLAYGEEDSIYIRVGEAQVKKSLLAIPAFKYIGAPSSQHRKIGVELYKVVYNDLDVSNYFTFIRHEAFVEDPAKTSLRPKPADPQGFTFSSWAAIGTEFLIRAGYRVHADNVQLEAYLYSVPKGELVLGKVYRGSRNAVRKIAHTFSAEVLEKLTGKKGMFLSKIVASSDNGSPGTKEIFVMDWDAANAKQVTNHRSISVSPSWAPDGRSVGYTSYTKRKDGSRNPDFYIYELYTGKRWLVSQRNGINSGSVFLPDNKHILITISPRGSTPDIYKIDRTGKILQRLTRGPRRAMNVEPAVSRDGKKVAFSSDRSGRPNVYVMGISGSAAKLMTFAGVYNSTPTWSPDGKKLAFASFQGGVFDLYIMNADGTGLRRLTKSKRPNGKPASSEDPSFSPDGRHILFVSDRSGKRQLYLINPDGTNERRISNDQSNYYNAKWSYHF